MKQKMINEMFKRITKGPARADVILKSKKHFAKAGSGWKEGIPNELHIFHWYHGDYNIQIIDYNKHDYRVIAGGFTSWKEAFEWAVNYILNEDF